MKKIAALHRLSPAAQAKRRAAAGLGHPLYVNGSLMPGPVNISHVPGPVGNYYDVPAGVGMGDVDPSMGGLGAYVAYAPQLGADTLPGSDKASLPPAEPSSVGFVSPFLNIWKYVAPLSALACAYHGYKRNDSIGWALWWGLVGSMPITPVIALAQGFGKRKGMMPNRRRRGTRRRRNPKRSGALSSREQIALAGKTAHERRADVVNSFNQDFHSGKLGDLSYSADAAWKIYKAAYDRSRRRR